jgi:DNA repair exonuclease SbcCD nuclease subunit
MLKALVLGDCHFCDRLPIKRQDDFFNAQFRKLEVLKTIATDHKVDGLFLLGDVFDRHSPDIWFVNEIMRRLSELPCPIYAIVGNHCVHGRVDSVDDVGLGTLFSSGIVRRISGDLTIKGTPIRALDYVTRHSVDMYKTDIPRLMFTHNMITPSKVIFEHILAKDIAAVAPGSIIFSGHYHPPFVYPYGIHRKKNEAIIINPGVMVRTDVSEKGIDPSVILFEVTEASQESRLLLSFKKLPLKGDPGDDVFDVVGHKDKKEEEVNLQQFITDIKETQFQSQDIEAMILELGKDQNVDDNVVTEALERIKTAKASL